MSVAPMGQNEHCVSSVKCTDALKEFKRLQIAKYSKNKGLYEWPFITLYFVKKNLTISTAGWPLLLKNIKNDNPGLIPRLSISCYFLFRHREHCSLKFLIAQMLLIDEIIDHWKVFSHNLDTLYTMTMKRVVGPITSFYLICQLKIKNKIQFGLACAQIHHAQLFVIFIMFTRQFCCYFLYCRKHRQ